MSARIGRPNRRHPARRTSRRPWHAGAMLLASSLASASASAQPTASGAGGPGEGALEDVVVTAYRVPTLQREAVDNVTIVPRGQIERHDFASGVDLFRQVPGLQVDQLGGPGGISLPYIRGSDPNHVLVLIDGVRVNDPTNSRGGAFDLSGLDPSQVERVEVLRGAASSVYGADAMGGVINIVTRGAARNEPSAEIGAGAGGQHYRNLHARAAAGVGAARFSLGASRLRDGSDAIGGALDRRVFTGSARFAIGATGGVDLDLRHGERESTNFPDDSGGLRRAVLRTLDRRQASDTSWSVRGWHDFGEIATLNAALTHYQRGEDIDSPGVAPGVRSPIGLPAAISRSDFERDAALANVVFHHPGGSELALGLEYQREHGADRIVYTLFGMPIPADFDLRRNTRSGFAELKWLATENLVVRGGLRHDRVDGIGSDTSPSAGIRYALRSTGGSVRASYSEGFKPPSFFALGLPPLLSGNPDLRAEHSKGGSVGYEQPFADGAGNAAVTLFRTRYTDLVTFDNTTNQLVNASTVNVRGAEFEVRWKASDVLLLSAHFTRLITRVADSDEPLRQRPGRRAGVQASWQIDTRWSFAWSTEYAADVFDSSIPTGNVLLPTYLRSDAAVVLRANRWLRAAFAIDNVMDKRNEWYVGFVAPGRRVRLDLTATF
ncbi:MAG: TonB-dependent receptor [Burkholderiaceae bacterium]|nr:TonB-dependent receptor [Burkholderiaceae bacterium]